jgi:hypothetical protein
MEQGSCVRSVSNGTKNVAEKSSEGRSGVWNHALQLDNNFYRGLLHRGWERAQWRPDELEPSSASTSSTDAARITTHQWVWDHEGSESEPRTLIS